MYIPVSMESSEHHVREWTKLGGMAFFSFLVSGG